MGFLELARRKVKEMELDQKKRLTPDLQEATPLDFQKKWLTTTGTIRKQRKEIDSLKNEVTRLQRENYRLLDDLHATKQQPMEAIKKCTSTVSK